MVTLWTTQEMLNAGTTKIEWTFEWEIRYKAQIIDV